MINAIQIALSGLTAASKKTEAAASNIANLGTAGSLTEPDNSPYTPLEVQQSPIIDSDGNGAGVESEFVPRQPPFSPSYAPDSPFADDYGLIGAPNVDLAQEAVNLKLAELSFKANAKIIKAASEMQEELIKTFDTEA